MDFLNTFLTIFITLVIIMDPLGNLTFFLLFTHDNTAGERKIIAARASGAAGVILILFGLTGDIVLHL